MGRLFYFIVLFSLFILYFFSAPASYSKNIFAEDSYDNVTLAIGSSELFVIGLDKDVAGNLSFYEYMLYSSSFFTGNKLVVYLYDFLPNHRFRLSIFTVVNSISFSRETVFTHSKAFKAGDYIIDLSETNTASSILSFYVRSFGVLSSNDIRYNDLVRELSSYRTGIVFGDIFLSIYPFRVNILFLY